MAWTLTVGTASVVSAVDIADLSITDSGPNAVGHLRAVVRNPTRAFTLAGGTVTLADGTATVWQGTLVGRTYEPGYGNGNDIAIEAVDLSAWLDREYVASETFAAGSSDRDAVQQLVASYGTAVGLSAPDATVEWTKDDVDFSVIENQTLRQAIQTVADSTISVDPSGVEWDTRYTPITQWWSGIAYNGSNQWVVTSWEGGTVITSPDSYTWATDGTAVYAWALSYGGSRYVGAYGALSSDINPSIYGGTASAVYWSSNGTSWSSAALGTAVSDTYYNVVQADSPSGYWSLDETSGTVAYASPGPDGTYIGTYTLGTAGALSDAPDNYAVSFGGTASYVDCGSTIAVNTSAYTIEAWVYSTSAGQVNKAIAGKWSGAGGGAMLYADGSGHYAIAHSTATANFLQSTTTPALNTWQHVAGVWTGASAIIYVNGTSVASKALATGPGTNSVTFQIARYANTANWLGRLDEVALYDTALSSATVSAHYKAGTATRHGMPLWYGAAYGTAGWVLAGRDVNYGMLAFSTSGTASWSIPYQGTALGFGRDVTSAGGTFLAALDTAVLYSTNGTAWSTATTAVGLGALSVGSDGTAVLVGGYGGSVFYAPSVGGTYTAYQTGIANRLNKVIWWPDASLWVAIGAGGEASTSTNGTAWTLQTTDPPGWFTSVAIGAQKLVTAGYNNIVGSRVQDTTPRTFYVDELGKLHYGVATGTAAPYAISDTPNGTTTLGAEDLEVEYDESAIVNRVWVATAPTDPTYSAWVEDTDSIATYGPRSAALVNELAVDATSAERYGRSYLAARAQPTVRGRFAVTGKDGWKAGQTVTITNTALGLSGSYDITSVETEFLTGTGTRRYRIAFGGLPKSLVRALAEDA